MRKLTVLAAAGSLMLLSGCTASPDATVHNVVVPHLVGKGADVARDTLVDDRLLIKYDAGDASVWAASGWIVEGQSPRAGAEVTPGTTITLTVRRK